MASIWGMDIAQVRELAALLGQKASDLDGIISSITAKLSGTQWEGPDAQKFRSDWSGTITNALRQSAQQLRDTQQRATQNAADQESTSNAG